MALLGGVLPGFAAAPAAENRAVPSHVARVGRVGGGILAEVLAVSAPIDAGP